MGVLQQKNIKYELFFRLSEHSFKTRNNFKNGKRKKKDISHQITEILIDYRDPNFQSQIYYTDLILNIKNKR